MVIHVGVDSRRFGIRLIVQWLALAVSPLEQRLRGRVHTSQTELGAELGGQPVVSAILKGKCAIIARQARTLASRFNVRPAVFIA